MSVVKMYASGDVGPSVKLYVSITSGRVGPKEDGDFVGFSGRGVMARDGDLIDVVTDGVVVDGVVYAREEICVSE